MPLRDLAEQAAQEPRERHRRAVVAGTSLGAALGIFERRQRVEHDAQVVLSRDLALSLRGGSATSAGMGTARPRGISCEA